MKKFKVITIYDAWDTYEVEAENEEEARNIVMEGDAEPYKNDTDNFFIDSVEEVKE